MGIFVAIFTQNLFFPFKVRLPFKNGGVALRRRSATVNYRYVRSGVSSSENKFKAREILFYIVIQRGLAPHCKL